MPQLGCGEMEVGWDSREDRRNLQNCVLVEDRSCFY